MHASTTPHPVFGFGPGLRIFRFGVLAKKGLRSFGGDDLRPGKCPGQPVVWLEQQGPNDRATRELIYREIEN